MDDDKKAFLEWLIEDINVSWHIMWKKHTKKFEAGGQYTLEIAYFQELIYRGNEIIKIGGEQYTTIFFYPLTIKNYLSENT